MDDLVGKSQELDAQVVSSLEEFFSYADNNYDCMGNERPASAMSLNSWTFSPIAQEECGVNDDVELTGALQQSTNQPAISQNTQPMGNVVSTQPMVECNSLTNNNDHINTASENVYPGNITYHQSVNIHNYVGNYNMGQGQATWYQTQPHGTAAPNLYPVLSAMHQQQQVQIPQQQHFVQTGEHYDQYTAINTTGQEINRCSTPDYLMALNSLNQLDSPPRPNHDAATNINYSCISFNESMHNKSTSSVKHDSGYVSDISESPVVQYNNNSSSVHRSQQSQLTSTPLSAGQYKITNVMLLNKENMASLHQQLHGLRFAQPKTSVKQANNAEPKHVKIVQQTVKSPAVPNVLKETSKQVPITRDIKPSQKTVIQYANMAEYQQAQRSKMATLKTRKLTTNTTLTHQTSSTTSNRRHNQPLSKTAHDILNGWYTSHIENPYPNKQQKEELSRTAGITMAQVKSWFANKRNRSQNTRPKKQMIQMESKLMDICHQLARDASKPYTDNAYYIQQLSSILHK